MGQVAFKRKKITTSGSLPAVGTWAPNFVLVDENLEEVSLEAFGNKIKILSIFPSLDTGVCATSVRKFHEKIANDENIVVLNISMDLPFAQKRFCREDELENIVVLSAFRSSFGKDYGVLITDGPIRGLLSRAVVVLDGDNRVLYTEQVPEITEEPHYERVLEYTGGM